jgi:hypothetical protein
LKETKSAALAVATRRATSMKMLFLFLLMTSIWMASYYGSAAAAMRQQRPTD